MSIRTQLTIRDYLANAGLAWKSGSAANSSGNADKGDFSRILEKLASSHQPDAAVGGTGLRIADYRKNPIQSRIERLSPVSQPPSKTTGPTIGDGAVDAAPLPQSRTQRPAADQSTAATVSENTPQHPKPPHTGDDLSSRIDGSIQKAARKYKLSSQLIRSVIQAESNFKPMAVSAAGAQGLMQLMPGTAKELGVADPFDVDQNIDGGARYLRQMLDMFDGDLKQALAAYNAGPGTVLKYKGNVPYRETRTYVRKVIALANRKDPLAAL